MSGISKRPPQGTPLSIIVKTPAGNVLVGITIEVIGLRKEVSTEAGNGNRIRGQKDYLISAQEIDDTRNSPSQNTRGFAEDECELNVIAFAPNTRLGPDVQPFKAGNADMRTIKLKKGDTRFGPKTPLVLELVEECLANFKIDPPILRKRVRNLSVDEAWQELVERHRRKLIRLIPEPVFDGSCGPRVPLGKLPRKKFVMEDGKPKKDEAGHNILEDVLDDEGQPAFATIEMVGMEPRVGTVAILNNNFPKHSSKGSPSAISNVNPINLAGLVRLSLLLQRRFGITELHHCGVSRGQILNAGDCHSWGRAIDFVAVRIPDPVMPANSFLLNLQEDWAGESVPKTADIGARPSRNPRDAAWPTKELDTEFRFLSLNLDLNPADAADEQQRVVDRALNDKRLPKDAQAKLQALLKKKPAATAQEIEDARAPLLAARAGYVRKAQAFFQYFFDWAADNYTQGSALPDPVDAATGKTPDAFENPDDPMPALPPPGDMGRGGFVMHPDHKSTNTSGTPPKPDPNAKNGREAHNGHYHIQIGPTGATDKEKKA